MHVAQVEWKKKTTRGTSGVYEHFYRIESGVTYREQGTDHE